MIRLILLIFILTHLDLHSQDKGTFRAYVQAGFNTSHISGDSVSGFNYWSFRGGAGAYFMISNRISANLEINYTMKGASGPVIGTASNITLYHRTIHNNYVEAPIMVQYHDGNIARFGAGFYLASQISNLSWYNKKANRSEEIQNLFNQLDIGVVGSVTFDIKKHFGVNMRMTHSIIPFNKPRPNEDDMYHINLSGSVIYYF